MASSLAQDVIPLFGFALRPSVSRTTEPTSVAYHGASHDSHFLDCPAAGGLSPKSRPSVFSLVPSDQNPPLEDVDPLRLCPCCAAALLAPANNPLAAKDILSLSLSLTLTLSLRSKAAPREGPLPLHSAAFPLPFCSSKRRPLTWNSDSNLAQGKISGKVFQHFHPHRKSRVRGGGGEAKRLWCVDFVCWPPPPRRRRRSRNWCFFFFLDSLSRFP